MWKLIYTISIILVIGVLGWWLLASKNAKAPVATITNTQIETLDSSELGASLSGQPNTENQTQSNTNTQSEKKTTDQVPVGQKGVFSTEEDIAGEEQVHKVLYDSQGFSPDVITIKLGDIVVFENQITNKKFQPASDPHPSHTGYSGFDALTPLSSSDAKFSFKFSKTGSFGYHDHLNPARKGIINVKE